MIKKYEHINYQMGKFDHPIGKHPSLEGFINKSFIIIRFHEEIVLYDILDLLAMQAIMIKDNEEIMMYTVVPGYILKYKSENSKSGNPVSKIDTITSVKEKSEITDLLVSLGFKGRINFWE